MFDVEALVVFHMKEARRVVLVGLRKWRVYKHGGGAGVVGIYCSLPDIRQLLL
jgi:hypothetical protein